MPEFSLKPFDNLNWREPVKQYGTFADVQFSFFSNLENIFKIDYQTCVIAMPMWGPGDQQNFGVAKLPSVANNTNFQKNSLYFNGSTADITFSDPSALKVSEFSIISKTTILQATDSFPKIYDWNNDNYGALLQHDGTTLEGSIGNGSGYDIHTVGTIEYGKPFMVCQNLKAGRHTAYFEGEEKFDIARTISYTGVNDFRLGTRGADARHMKGWFGLFIFLNSKISLDTYRALEDNPYQLWQPVPQKTTFLPFGGDTILPINFTAQAQSIDSIDLIQHNTLSINPINQSQSISNIDLIISINLIIGKMIQNQSTENIPLLQHNILAIDKLEQIQGIDNIDLIIAGVLSIAPIIMSQDIDNIIIIQHNNIVIDGIDHTQELEQITLDTGILLQIAEMVQNQSIDSLVLTQAHIIEIDKLLQGQAIENIILSIIGEKIVITLTVKSPGIDLSVNSPGISLEVE